MERVYNMLTDDYGNVDTADESAILAIVREYGDEPRILANSIIVNGQVIAEQTSENRRIA